MPSAVTAATVPSNCTHSAPLAKLVLSLRMRQGSVGAKVFWYSPTCLAASAAGSGGGAASVGVLVFPFLCLCWGVWAWEESAKLQIRKKARNVFMGCPELLVLRESKL